MKLAWLGAGNMGMALLEGAARRGALTPREVTVIDVDDGKLAAAAGLGFQTSTDATPARDAEAMMLAVKPQVFGEVAKTIGRLSKPTVVMSIMAGVESGAIRRALGDLARVIRIMPNVACRIGEGMSGIALGAGARAGDDDLATRILNAVGQTVRVDEELMHAVTAVSGSGPAYVFLLAQAMEESARSLGLAEREAKLMVRQTILGSARLLLDGEPEAQALRASVTSKGGTTAAAIGVFEAGGFGELVGRALRAARDRGVELGGG